MTRALRKPPVTGFAELRQRAETAERTLTEYRRSLDLTEAALRKAEAERDAERTARATMEGALETLDNLLSEEIKKRFGTSSHMSEAEVAGKSRIYPLLLIPRNIARRALQGGDEGK